MWEWLSGPGKAFLKPLPGSTNYLGAYRKDGALIRAGRDTRRDDRKKRQDPQSEEETLRQEEEEGIDAAEAERRAKRRVKEREETQEPEVAPERQSDLRPYPLNHDFASQPVLSEELREQIYQQVTTNRHDLETVAGTFGVDLRRVAAVVRLKTIEKQWLTQVRPHPFSYSCSRCVVRCDDDFIQNSISLEDIYMVTKVSIASLSDLQPRTRLPVHQAMWFGQQPADMHLTQGKRLATPYSEAVLAMLPRTPFSANANGVRPHETINDVPVHAKTRLQIFYSTSESRRFTREDAARVFDNTLLPVDKRIPIPSLVKLEKWNHEGIDRAERLERMRADDAEQQRLVQERERKTQAWEERTIKVVAGRRWDFKFQDVSAEKTGKDGRGRHAVGYRYGFPLEDRKRGQFKLPRSVE